MASEVLDHGTVSFRSEGRLLQELGLRLVASPQVALVELIKNAYDADSPDCHVRFSSDEHSLIVTDHGIGMTLEDFLNKWMQIATSSKVANQVSGRYKRPLTGAKGIGRFAVRFLGDHLTLESTARDRKRGYLTTLTADFNWPTIDKQLDLAQTKVSYRLTRAAEKAGTGTTLTIGKLRNAADFAQSRDLRAEVLKIVEPIRGLETGGLKRGILQAGLPPVTLIQDST
jgi:HSP90 family molecular chaperone